MSAFWDASCEDESGNSAVMLGRVGKHRGSKEHTEKQKKERNITSDRWHTFSALFLPETDNKTPCKWCKLEGNNLMLSCQWFVLNWLFFCAIVQSFNRSDFN